MIADALQPQLRHPDHAQIDRQTGRRELPRQCKPHSEGSDVENLVDSIHAPIHRMRFMADSNDFPCTLVIDIPFPSAKYAAIALRALQVDKELSPLVRRSFAVKATDTLPSSNGTPNNGATGGVELETVLEVSYAATTPRMLRVAVNGFFESLGVVLGVMEELDVDVLALPGKESVAGAQGIELLEGEA